MTTVAWDSGWPSWSDGGKTVEVERDDGTLVRGTLVIEDAYPDGDGDEFPVWGIEVDGRTEGFALHKRWRFL